MVIFAPRMSVNFIASRFIEKLLSLIGTSYFPLSLIETSYFLLSVIGTSYFVYLLAIIFNWNFSPSLLKSVGLQFFNLWNLKIWNSKVLCSTVKCLTVTKFICKSCTTYVTLLPLIILLFVTIQETVSRKSYCISGEKLVCESANHSKLYLWKLH